MSTLSLFECLKLFKENTLKFFDALIEQFPEETDFIIGKIFFENEIPIEEALKRLSSKMVPLTDIIRKKEERFFLEDNEVFSQLNKERVIKYRQMWKSNRLTTEDREMFWKWFRLFLGISEQYQKLSAK